MVVSLFDRERRARLVARHEEELRLARAAAETARALQEALLPHALPTGERVRVTSRYLPGTDGAEVGGDFFDAIRTDTAFVLVMGDVQGHNSAAAALMGRVRTAVRAYVSEGHEPSAVLERTNRLMQSFEGDLFATCCLLALDERTGEVAVASAGHPAPVVAAGEVGALEVDPGPPLGCRRRRRTRRAGTASPGPAGCCCTPTVSSSGPGRAARGPTRRRPRARPRCAAR